MQKAHRASSQQEHFTDSDKLHGRQRQHRKVASKVISFKPGIVYFWKMPLADRPHRPAAHI